MTKYLGGKNKAEILGATRRVSLGQQPNAYLAAFSISPSVGWD